MTPGKPTRRAFLKGRAAVDAVANWADGASAAATLADPAASGYLVVYSRRAMATNFQIMVNARQYPEAADAAVAALDLIDQLEDQLTVYRDTSEVTAINHEAAAGPVAVEPGLYALLKEAQRLHDLTEGAFDITAGPLAKAWGFYRRQGAIPEKPDLAAALENVSMRHVLFDDESCTVRFAKPGVEINLGAIGKGYALDRGAELLASRGIHDFLLHGGQSSVVAHGSANSSAEKDGWGINLGDPQRPGERLATFSLRDRALGTSGAAYQSFRHQGRRYGHILDPRTGWPAEGVLSATVIATSAAAADALSTAAYVLGEAGASAMFEQNQELAGLLVLPGEQAGSARLRTFGLSEDNAQSADLS